MNLNWKLAVALIMVSFTSSVSALADLQVLGYSAPLHDRFADDPSFIGNPYDWSGVGVTASGRWITMISPTYFLSAFHYQPAINESVTLFGSNDGTGAQNFSIQSGSRIGNTDLWLGRLDGSTTLATYGVASIPLLNAGQEITVFGVASGYPQGQGQRMGRNQVDFAVDDFQNPMLVGVTDVIFYDFDTSGGVGADEAKIEDGDSGAPTFVIVDGQPLLLGIHWFKFSGANAPLSPTGSGDSYVPSYINEISAAMLGEQLTIVAVPEPGSLTLLGLAAVAPLLVQQARRKRGLRSAVAASPADAGDGRTPV